MIANKGFQATAHKLSHGIGLRSLHSLFLQPVGRRLNPDVGSGIMSCRAHNGSSTTDDTKVTNHAGTISESEARNSR